MVSLPKISNTRFLIMCCTYRRPRQFNRMLKSFFKTKKFKNTNMIVYLSEDDPHKKQYQRILSKFNLFHETGPHKYMCEAFNYFFRKYPDLEYYGEINDDQVYITENWDEMLINTLKEHGDIGIVSANDLFDESWNEHKHPTACIVSGNICRLFNRYQLDGLRQFGGDMYFKHLANSSNCLFFNPKVIIKHIHPKMKDIEKSNDLNYRFVYSNEERNNFIKVWNEYSNKNRRCPGMLDVMKLKDFIKNERQKSNGLNKIKVAS